VTAVSLEGHLLALAVDKAIDDMTVEGGAEQVKNYVRFIAACAYALRF